MSKYEVRFIKQQRDPDSAHVVVVLEAQNHDEALQYAREAKKGEVLLAEYGFWSVAVTRF